MVGKESMVGEAGKVVSRQERKPSAQYIVRCQGELWAATSHDELSVGEQVRVVSLDGSRLVVERARAELWVNNQEQFH